MSLTRGQRGDVTEGWNDCPPMMLQNASSSSLNLQRRDVDIENVIEELTGFPTNLSDRLMGQIKTKLLQASRDVDGALLHEVVEQVKANVEVGTIKSQIIDYMMINDGVTSWCSPLKKLVENIDR